MHDNPRPAITKGFRRDVRVMRIATFYAGTASMPAGPSKEHARIIMRTTLPLWPVLVAGCASARPQPVPVPVAAATDVVATLVDSTRAARVTVTGAACETNDPMAVRTPLASGTTRRNAPGSIPTATSPRSLPYIPNACPVTAGPLSTRAVPAVVNREPKPWAPRGPLIANGRSGTGRGPGRFSPRSSSPISLIPRPRSRRATARPCPAGSRGCGAARERTRAAGRRPPAPARPW